MIRCCLVLLCAWSAIDAQPGPKLEFEAASIKPTPRGTGQGTGLAPGCHGGPGTSDPVSYTCGNLSFSILVSTAYNVRSNQLSAPSWADMARFDLRAKLPEGATTEQLPLMLQNLLQDRFKLAVHRESRELQGYELTVAKSGPKFKTADALSSSRVTDSAPARGPNLDKDGYPVIAPRGGIVVGDKAKMYWPEITMATLADRLGGQLRGPVINATGLNGTYEIELHWVPLPAGAEPATQDLIPSGPDLKRALQEQLGLSVESRKVQVEFVVVDRAEKTPTDD